ncbi:MAG: ribosome small subunit-dependent GTPase A [Rubripirellula sp.]|jgi:ribosome biogenesis GTPase|nr:ribosome small subunit-dependent GTPase A [Rubripirellula sp.]
MAKNKRQKNRASFKKKHQDRVRQSDFTRDFHAGDQETLADVDLSERVSGKGELTRKRTYVDLSGDNASHLPDYITGRVISVHGLKSRVLGEDGVIYECALRQVLKSLNIDQRSAVVAGDHVRLRAATSRDGMIESVAPRQGIISRTSRGQQHILVANVDYLLIIASAAEPGIKPALIDRFLLTAEHCGVKPVVVINKTDLVNPTSLQQLVGVYASLGYRVLLTSAERNLNIEYLKALLHNKQTALAGQSGVGKSSLLNAIEPGLGLAVASVSQDNEKGRHTTTAAQLIPLQSGGAVFDTPGIRQFQLWDIQANEVAGLMPDLRPFVNSCRYTDCLHLNEDQCAIKDAVADGKIDSRRYDSYCHLLESDLLLGDLKN